MVVVALEIIPEWKDPTFSLVTLSLFSLRCKNIHLSLGYVLFFYACRIQYSLFHYFLSFISIDVSIFVEPS